MWLRKRKLKSQQMDDGNMNGMGGMSKLSTMNNPMVMSQMTFFWSKNAYILFCGWPGTSIGMYVLALIFIFVLSIFVEWLSHCQLIKPSPKHVVFEVVIYKYVVCWLLFRAKFDCNFIQSFVPCIYCGI